MDQRKTPHPIGHSNMGRDEFIGLLESRGTQAVADIRGMPHRRRVPWFNREPRPLEPATRQQAGQAAYRRTRR